MATYDTLWQQIVEEIRDTESVAVYKTWFLKTNYIDGSEDEILIGCPNQVVLSQMEKRYRKKLESMAKKLIGHTIELRFIVQQTEVDEDPASTSPLFDELPQPETSGEASIFPELLADSQAEERTSYSQSDQTVFLNPNYTFDQFVVGGSNRVAHAAALAVTDRPGQTYNPLFIYGGTGVGKTHLVQAIGNELLQKKPKPKVLYFSIEKFVNEFVDSMRFKNMNEFKKRYRSADVLIVDDIQYIAGKAGTQEEFFHTFNELYASGRQIILCSDRPPREIASLVDRLTSRFEGGLIVDINAPDFETRSAIIRAKADQLSIDLSSEIADFIASLAPDNIRALEGIMLKLKSMAMSTDQPLTLAMAQSLFHKTNETTSLPKKQNPNQVLKIVCETYGVTLKDITGKSRTQQLVVPRQLAMYILRQDAGLNLESIGHMLGGRDHTTIMHGIDKVRKLVQSDDQTRSALSAIRQVMAEA